MSLETIGYGIFIIYNEGYIEQGRQVLTYLFCYARSLVSWD